MNRDVFFVKLTQTGVKFVKYILFFVLSSTMDSGTVLLQTMKDLQKQ